MDIVSTLSFLLEEFDKQKLNYAIIGGLALHTAGVARATSDIDFLVLIADKEMIKEILKKIDYELKFESINVLNFFGKDGQGRVDFLIAHRKYARSMLERAKELPLFGMFKAKVVTVEDQIGLKVQSISNDKERYFQDMSDIQLLIKNNLDKMNLELVKEYFKLFKKEEELEKILKVVKNA